MTKKHTHFAQIPKIASVELNPYELALYTNYVHSCGISNDACIKSHSTLALETKMSVSQVKRCKFSLEEKGYITIKSGGDRKPSIIHYRDDIWERNEQEFADKHGSHRTQSDNNMVLTEPNIALTEPSKALTEPSKDQTRFSQSHKEYKDNNKRDIVTKRDDSKSESKNTYTPELKNCIAKEIFGWHDPSKVTPKNWKRVMKVLKQIFAVHDCYGTICTVQHIARFLSWYRTNKPGWGLPQNEGMETAYQEYYESMRSREAISVSREHIYAVNLMSEPPEMPEPVTFGAKPHV